MNHSQLALMKAKQVAEWLSVSIRQVSRIQHEIGVVRIGKGGIRFDPRQVQAYIEKGGVNK